MPSIIPPSKQLEQITRRSVRILCAETLQSSTETIIERAPSQTQLPAIKPPSKPSKQSEPSKHPKLSKLSKPKSSSDDREIRTLKSKIAGLRDEVELEWKPRVKSLKEKCDKLGKKVDLMQDTKEENAAMKRKLAKSNVEKEKIERDNYDLKVRVKELMEKLTMSSKDAKEMQRDLTSAENGVLSLANKKRALESKVDKLEKSETSAKREHMKEMKHLQLEITKEKLAGAVKVVEDRKKAAE